MEVVEFGLAEVFCGWVEMGSGLSGSIGGAGGVRWLDFCVVAVLGGAGGMRWLWWFDFCLVAVLGGAWLVLIARGWFRVVGGIRC